MDSKKGQNQSLKRHNFDFKSLKQKIFRDYPYRTDQIKYPIKPIKEEAGITSEYDLRKLETRKELAKIVGLEKFFNLRDRWSEYILNLIWAMLLFQFLIVISVGFGFLDLAEYKWLVLAIVGENFVHIIGMGVVIVKFLFPNNKGS